MMEIKVRAWDNHEKRWAKTHEIENELFINPEADDTGVFYIHDKSASGKLHYTLVRSTGLHDKNGKEIYEGDIVKCLSHKDIPLTVEYCDGAYEMITKNGGYAGRICNHSPQHFEVIGHIYEVSN